MTRRSEHLLDLNTLANILKHHFHPQSPLPKVEYVTQATPKYFTIKNFKQIQMATQKSQKVTTYLITCHGSGNIK